MEDDIGKEVCRVCGEKFFGKNTDDCCPKCYQAEKEDYELSVFTEKLTMAISDYGDKVRFSGGAPELIDAMKDTGRCICNRSRSCPCYQLKQIANGEIEKV